MYSVENPVEHPIEIQLNCAPGGCEDPDDVRSAPRALLDAGKVRLRGELGRVVVHVQHHDLQVGRGHQSAESKKGILNHINPYYFDSNTVG